LTLKQDFSLYGFMFDK